MTGVEVGILIVGGVLVAAEIVEAILSALKRRRDRERASRRLDELNTPEQQYGVVRRAA